MRREFAGHVRQAMARLPQADQEVLMMRKLEGLSNQETAQVLRIDPATASRRYGRAVLRLRDMLLESGLLEPEP
jgi:RNA polymerase sigma-70 factor (ECF subfamily)